MFSYFFDLGQVEFSVISLEVVAVVVNNPSNIVFTTLTSSAILSYGTDSSTFTFPSQSTSMMVVEPHLTISKSALSLSDTPSAGTIVEYTLTISHTSASTAPAFAVQLIDSSPELVIDASSVMSALGQVVSVNSTGMVMEFDVIPLGDPLVVKYNATLADLVPVGMIS